MKTPLRFRLGVCLVGTLIASVAVGFGDVSADEPDAKSRAQALFLDGRKAIDEGNWDAGCPKVRDSLELFAVANSHFTVAQCDEREKHIAGALEHWERGLGLVDASDARAKVAKERIAALDPRVPRIRVVIPPASAGASVWLDDVKLEAAVLGTPLRVEPGKHVFVVRATGRQDNRKAIDIAEKERTEFVANIGAPGTPGPLPTGSSSAAPLPTNSSPPTPPMHPRKVAGFVVGGIGVASLLVSAGTAFGVKSQFDSMETCNKTKSCSATEISKYQSLYIANAVTFGIGLAGVGAGLILILTAPKAAESKPAEAAVVPLVVPGGAGIGLSGRF